jgi:hypothetical protein
MRSLAAALLFGVALGGCTKGNTLFGPDFGDAPPDELLDGSVQTSDSAVADLSGVVADLSGIGADLSGGVADLSGVVADLSGADLTGIASDLAGVSSDLQMPPACGNGRCEPSETCTSCPDDCGLCASCSTGFADCDATPGCETAINTAAHCGGCSNTCSQTGGTNPCVATGDTFICQPACDSAHGDCDASRSNGCETAVNTVDNCGGCGLACVAAGGTNNCVAGVSGFSCVPSCDAAHLDCDGDGRNGCEADGSGDPGEPGNNVCAGQQVLPNVVEGTMVTVTTSRILPTGDADIFQTRLIEATHSCSLFATQNYTGYIQVVSPGAALSVRRSTLDDSTAGTCSDTGFTPPESKTCLPLSWTGTCGFTDQKEVSVKVSGPASCQTYTLRIVYCNEDTTCIPAGCI